MKSSQSCIVIDELLKNNDSFLKNEFKHLFIFDQWGPNQFANIDDKLKTLIQNRHASVVHTNMHGLRGVDFRMDTQTHVILAFNPKNYFDIV